MLSTGPIDRFAVDRQTDRYIKRNFIISSLQGGSGIWVWGQVEHRWWIGDKFNHCQRRNTENLQDDSHSQQLFFRRQWVWDGGMAPCSTGSVSLGGDKTTNVSWCVYRGGGGWRGRYKITEILYRRRHSKHCQPARINRISYVHWIDYIGYVCLLIFSRLYCYRSAIAIMSSVCPSDCNAVHCSSRGQCTELKVVPACS